MKSIGKIVYSPRSHLGSSKEWAAVMCDDELSKYYCHLYTMEYPYLNSGRSLKLSRTIWGAHISFIRATDKDINMKLWGLSANKIIEFEYEPGVLDNGTYYWLKVKCKVLSDIRKQYGLSAEPRFGLHLTVGRATNN